MPLPDESQREMLWSAMLPGAHLRAEDLDLRGLAASFAMSGGYIKNAVLRAAYLAAHEGSVITDAHLWRAARAEYEGMGNVAYQRRPAASAA